MMYSVQVVHYLLLFHDFDLRDLAQSRRRVERIY